MDIEKTLVLAAPAQDLWARLLDPRVMGACVPGMQSIEVVSDTQYISNIHVKVAFVSARFRINTTIVEQRAPHYLRSESVGEDAAVASSLKQASEIFLVEQPDGRTELRMKIRVDVLGRLGTFGLSAMKTKADRMWEEFAQKLTAQLVPAAPEAVEPEAVHARSAEAEPERESATLPRPALQAKPEGAAAEAPRFRVNGLEISGTQATDRGWWSRMLASLSLRRDISPNATARTIHVEVRRADTTIIVEWPLEGASECRDWLRECLR